IIWSVAATDFPAPVVGTSDRIVSAGWRAVKQCGHYFIPIEAGPIRYIWRGLRPGKSGHHETPMSIERNEREQRAIRPERRAAGQPGSSYIRLHSDENPYGCSLSVLEALGSSDRYSLPADLVATEL